MYISEFLWPQPSFIVEQVNHYKPLKNIIDKWFKQPFSREAISQRGIEAQAKWRKTENQLISNFIKYKDKLHTTWKKDFNTQLFCHIVMYVLPVGVAYLPPLAKILFVFGRLRLLQGGAERQPRWKGYWVAMFCITKT